MPVTAKRIIILMTACLLPICAWSIQLNVPLVEKKPTIDGNVTAAEQQAAASLDMTRIGGLDRPRFDTKVYVAATLEGLYVGFVANEPVMDSLVTSTTQANGAVFNDDSVQVLLSPSLDTAADAYYHFAINPEGIRYSNHLITGEVVGTWEAEVKKGANSWQAEFFIPLTSIEAPYELPYWRANFARVRPARPNAAEETSAWVNPGISLHNYKRFGYLTMPRFVPPAPTDNARFTTSPVEVITTRTTAVPRD